MCVDKLIIHSKIKDYSVFFVNNKDFMVNLIKNKDIIFIVDSLVYDLYKDDILIDIPEEKLILLKISETVKTITTVCYLYDKIMRFAPRKNLTIVSIGGGITQDITGFVASSLYRGVKWIYVPTTLLSQVDSCIGAKTSLNYKHFKNLVGTFYPPSEVYIYPKFLKSLKRNDFYSGVGEMAKLHIINGEDATKDFINALPQIDLRDNDILLERILNCLKIKKFYIEEDEFDTGKRNMLNYGHCFGHALESATDFTIPHGQAVILGMLFANKVAVELGFLGKDTEAFISQNVLKPILTVEVPAFDTNKVLIAMQQDKKNLGSGLAMVMLKEGYSMVKITDLPEQKALSMMKSFFDEVDSPVETGLCAGLQFS